MMDINFKTNIWQQFGAAIDMLENALLACPEELWKDRSQKPEYWYTVFHTLFWLDFYLSESAGGFVPPAPFTLDELDPAGLLPERVYTKEELKNYLEHGRKKCKITIEAMTNEKANHRFVFGRVDLSFMELILYNLRHVQHHAGQLNLILRQTIDSVPSWVIKTKSKLSD
jgi:uncharacterized damage-inducible protein DinB